MGSILIADDHDALRRGLLRALTEAGHDCDEAPNGNAAIEKLHESYYDVVLSDLKMGGSDGIEVLKTTKAQGSGLGLAIVRKIIDAHDGQIDVTSTSGHGTRFTVTLPVSAGEEDWFQ